MFTCALWRIPPDALGAADVSIVSSGTATVEAALMDAPMIVVYQLAPLTAAIAKLLVRTQMFAMVNLIAGRRVVPELVQRISLRPAWPAVFLLDSRMRVRKCDEASRMSAKSSGRPGRSSAPRT